MRNIKVAVILLIAMLCGCVQVQKPNINQETVLIKIVAKDVIYFAGRDQFSKSMLLYAEDTIENKILPVLNSNKSITVAVANELIGKLDDKYSMIAEDAINLVQVFLVEKPLNETIGEDNTKRLIALFEGLLQGTKLLLEK